MKHHRVLLRAGIRWLHAAALVALAVGPAAASDLPPIDVVRGVRGARIAHAQGDHAGELAALRHVVELFPEDMASLHELLRFHETHAGNSDETARLEELLVRRLSQAGSQVQLDVLLVMASQSDDPSIIVPIADELERRVQTSGARDDETLEALLQLRLRLDQTSAAIETLERMVAESPTGNNRHRLLTLYEVESRWEDSAGLLKDWLAESPDLLLRNRYVRHLGRLGRLDELEEQLHLVLGQLADETPAMRNLVLGSVRKAAWNLRDAGEDAAAERLFRRVLEIDSDDEEAMAALLHLYGSEADLRSLQAEVSERWRQEDDPQALFAEGTNRLTSGDAESALPLLQRAAPGLPDLEPAWYNLGMAAYQLEDWPVVVEAFGRAAELNRTRAQTFLYRGLALEKLGRCGEAVTDLGQAVTLDPSRNIAHYFLAACFARLGEAARSAHHRELYQAGQEN